MKTIIIRSILTIGFFCPQFLQAQGTMTYLSNLGKPADGTNAVGSDSWLAAPFYTGTNAGGYSLDSIQLGMANASGNPTNFTVMLYSAYLGAGISPGTNLDTLDGSSNPATAGVYTFTTVSNLLLSPNRYYFIVLTAETTVANGAYEWNYDNTGSYNPVDNWIGAVTFGSGNGLSWTRLGMSPLYDYSQFAINATAIPEPGTLGLLGLGGLVFLWPRLKSKAL
jgi:hypothetical protein